MTLKQTYRCSKSLNNEIGLKLMMIGPVAYLGLELLGRGVEGLNPPPVHVKRRSFLSENRFKISIPGQNFKHFDI